MGAFVYWWVLGFVLVVYLGAVFSVALSQAFDGGGQWWEPFVVPPVFAALVLWQWRFAVGVVLIFVLWGILR